MASIYDGLDKIIYFGNQVSKDMRERIFAATYSLSTDAAGQLSLSLYDKDFQILRTGLVKIGLSLDYDTTKMEIHEIEIDEEKNKESVTIRATTLTSQKLRAAQGKKTIQHASPSDFVRIECDALKIPHVIQPSTVRTVVSRDVPEPGQQYDFPPCDWTTFKRLAGEVGFIFFEAAGTVYFGKPSWLLERGKAAAVKVDWEAGDPNKRPLTTPRILQTLDQAKRVTVEVDLPFLAYASVLPGQIMKLQSFPQYSNYYLIDSVDVDLMDGQGITVSASTPHDPDPLGDPESDVQSGDELGGGGSGGSSAGRGTAELFVRKALAQAGDRYVYGAEVDLDDPDPDAFDCCLTGDSLVYTTTGAVRIDEIVPGEFVWSWDNGNMVPREVVAQKQQKVQSVFNVRTRNRSVKASANHPFRVLTKQSRTRGTDGKWLPNEWVTEYKRVDELVHGDLLVVAKSTPLANYNAKLTDGTDIDEDVAWLMGLFMGDGHIPPRNPRVCVYGATRDRAAQIVKDKWGANSSCTETHGLIVHSAPMARAFIATLGEEKARTKRVPPVIPMLSPSLIRAFCAGYAAVDGHKDKRGLQSYSSASRDLVAGIRVLHIMLGDSVSNITTDDCNSPIKEKLDAAPLHTFTVYPDSQKQGQVLLGTYGARRALPDNNFTVECLLSVDYIGEEVTYDIQVEDTANFIADGISVSNSELTQWAAYQAGTQIPDGAKAQFVYCYQKGKTIPISQAINTRGALLFRTSVFTYDHVAISLGDGTTIEAAGREYGVCSLPATGRDWTGAGLVPGLIYT